MTNYRLYTVTTNTFSTFQVISSRSQDELELEYYEVADHGSVTDITTSMKSGDILFKHHGWLKKLDSERKID